MFCMVLIFFGVLHGMEDVSFSYSLEEMEHLIDPRLSNDMKSQVADEFFLDSKATNDLFVEDRCLKLMLLSLIKNSFELPPVQIPYVDCKPDVVKKPSKVCFENLSKHKDLADPVLPDDVGWQEEEMASGRQIFVEQGISKRKAIATEKDYVVLDRDDDAKGFSKSGKTKRVAKKRKHNSKASSSPVNYEVINADDNQFTTNNQNNGSLMRGWLFKCDRCSYTSDRLRSMREHKERPHTNKNCALCDEVINSAVDYRKHIQEKHLNWRARGCYCGYKTSKLDTLGNHMSTPHDLHLTCNGCDRIFISKGSRDHHRKETGHIYQ